MAYYVFLSDEPCDGSITGEMVEYSHIKRSKVLKYLEEIGQGWADEYGEPVTCWKLEPMGEGLREIEPSSWAEPDWDHEVRARQEDAMLGENVPLGEY